MKHIDKVVEGLVRLNEIVGHDGKWVNIAELHEELKQLPALLEHAVIAKEQLEELADPEYPDQQRILNHEYEVAV